MRRHASGIFANYDSVHFVIAVTVDAIFGQMYNIMHLLMHNKFLGLAGLTHQPLVSYGHRVWRIYSKKEKVDDYVIEKFLSSPS